ncbi:hypothetical protein [Sulfolobus acidocaldarius]|uniref:Uncharacterized protein n=3 Tax=Sulfolobus acidocaldarius TaxID=2285 RepID=M1IFG0_9CREN|nr:hypothetical protein [Sulfolobus acidocaldarius]AGE71851.1 hypothetical protein SacN8_09460 [Sulfolobus acidocaldarius N8]AGE74123.1 hypothetical protein SacRon12I_09480 [Sulfolobus acidocaldarius Ron12/I]ALU29964.1 hypothetical protein ATY89_08470 [Sulfolobus acidocaldarius]WCM35723.1 hypothetical protein GO597_10475 [Sulfolobus acidocaldarius DSM 639]
MKLTTNYVAHDLCFRSRKSLRRKGSVVYKGCKQITNWVRKKIKELSIPYSLFINLMDAHEPYSKEYVYEGKLSNNS